MAVLGAAAPFAWMALRILVQRRDPILSGDPALLDLAARSAAGFHRQVGPYSRFGYNHPGPALFYAAAPVYWATGRAAWALSLTVELVNGLAAAAIVLLLGLRSGSRAALLAAGVVLLYSWRVDVGLLQVPWNPLVILLPLALVLVAVALVDGAGVVLAAVIVGGTFVVQTHLGTTPVVVAVAALAAVFALAGRRVARGAALVGGAALVALAVLWWLPPLWQQATDHPGNLGLIVRFFRQPNPGAPSLGASLADTGRELAVLVRGIPYLGSLTPGRPGHAWSFVALAVGALSALAIVVGRLPTVACREAVRLGAVSLAAVVVSVWAVHSIRGEVYWYLVAWISAIAVPAALAWLLIIERLAGTRWAGGLLLVLFAGALAAALSAATGTRLVDNRAFPQEGHYRAETEAVWDIAKPALDAPRGPAGTARTVLLGSDSQSIPALAGLGVRLELRGLAVRVGPGLGVYFGPERVVHHALDASFWVGAAGDPPPAGSQLLGVARGVQVWRPPAGWAGQ